MSDFRNSDFRTSFTKEIFNDLSFSSFFAGQFSNDSFTLDIKPKEKEENSSLNTNSKEEKNDNRTSISSSNQKPSTIDVNVNSQLQYSSTSPKPSAIDVNFKKSSLSNKVNPKSATLATSSNSFSNSNNFENTPHSASSLDSYKSYPFYAITSALKASIEQKANLTKTSPTSYSENNNQNYYNNFNNMNDSITTTTSTQIKNGDISYDSGNQNITAKELYSEPISKEHSFLNIENKRRSKSLHNLDIDNTSFDNREDNSFIDLSQSQKDSYEPSIASTVNSEKSKISHSRSITKSFKYVVSGGKKSKRTRSKSSSYSSNNNLDKNGRNSNDFGSNRNIKDSSSIISSGSNSNRQSLYENLSFSEGVNNNNNNINSPNKIFNTLGHPSPNRQNSADTTLVFKPSNGAISSYSDLLSSSHSFDDFDEIISSDKTKKISLTPVRMNEISKSKMTKNRLVPKLNERENVVPIRIIGNGNERKVPNMEDDLDFDSDDSIDRLLNEGKPKRKQETLWEFLKNSGPEDFQNNNSNNSKLNKKLGITNNNNKVDNKAKGNEKSVGTKYIPIQIGYSPFKSENETNKNKITNNDQITNLNNINNSMKNNSPIETKPTYDMQQGLSPTKSNHVSMKLKPNQANASIMNHEPKIIKPKLRGIQTTPLKGNDYSKLNHPTSILKNNNIENAKTSLPFTKMKNSNMTKSPTSILKNSNNNNNNEYVKTNQPTSILKNSNNNTETSKPIQPTSILKNGNKSTQQQPTSILKNGNNNENMKSNQQQPTSILKNGNVNNNNDDNENENMKSNQQQPTSILKNGNVNNNDDNENMKSNQQQPTSILKNGNVNNDDNEDLKTKQQQQPTSILKNGNNNTETLKSNQTEFENVKTLPAQNPNYNVRTTSQLHKFVPVQQKPTMVSTGTQWYISDSINIRRKRVLFRPIDKRNPIAKYMFNHSFVETIYVNSNVSPHNKNNRKKSIKNDIIPVDFLARNIFYYGRNPSKIPVQPSIIEKQKQLLLQQQKLLKEQQQILQQQQKSIKKEKTVEVETEVEEKVEVEEVKEKIEIEWEYPERDSNPVAKYIFGKQEQKTETETETEQEQEQELDLSFEYPVRDCNPIAKYIFKTSELNSNDDVVVSSSSNEDSNELSELTEVNSENEEETTEKTTLKENIDKSIGIDFKELERKNEEERELIVNKLFQKIITYMKENEEKEKEKDEEEEEEKIKAAEKSREFAKLMFEENTKLHKELSNLRSELSAERVLRERAEEEIVRYEKLMKLTLNF